jgi:hypothetical protein
MSLLEFSKHALSERDRLLDLTGLRYLFMKNWAEHSELTQLFELKLREVSE